ncbi:MAG: alpha/beta hydrolase [Alphaproteobacteria bacterium]
MLRRFVLSFALLCHGGAAYAQGDLTEEPGFLRVTIGGRVARLEALTVKRADASGKLPIALITHGKPTTQGRMLDERASDYTRQAHDLARRGWLAVVVMRRGFGGSDGPSPVATSCASTSLIDRFAADADDLEAALDAIGKRPDADASRMIAIGVSAGGPAVTALSARNPKGLAGVINVSGGLRFLACPKEDALVAAFKAYGEKSRVPSLWIYAKNDSFFGPALVERMQAAFLDGGGDVKLVMLEADQRADGHFIFGLSFGRFKWLPQMDAFLRFHKLPTWTRDDVNRVMKQLNAKEPSRGFLESYVSGPSERALARQKSGTYMFETHGTRSIEDARKAALEACERRSQPCEVVMENDRWTGPAP